MRSAVAFVSANSPVALDGAEVPLADALLDLGAVSSAAACTLARAWVHLTGHDGARFRERGDASPCALQGLPASDEAKPAKGAKKWNAKGAACKALCNLIRAGVASAVADPSGDDSLAKVWIDPTRMLATVGLMRTGIRVTSEDVKQWEDNDERRCADFACSHAFERATEAEFADASGVVTCAVCKSDMAKAPPRDLKRALEALDRHEETLKRATYS